MEINRRGPNAARSLHTRRAIVRAAHRAFRDHGYDGVSLDAVLAATDLTKGALYHQFTNKADVLAAVVDEIQREVRRRVQRAVRGQAGAAALAVGCAAYLDAVTASHGDARLLFVESPAVLGWSRWRDIDDQHWYGPLQHAVVAAHSAEADALAITAALAAVLTRLASDVTVAADRRRALDQANATLVSVLATWPTV